MISDESLFLEYKQGMWTHSYSQTKETIFLKVRIEVESYTSGSTSKKPRYPT